MENKNMLSAIVGLGQGIIGLLSAAIAILLGLNIIEVQTMLNAPPELLPLYLLTLGLFSVFSVTSGLFLVRDWRTTNERRSLRID